MPTIPSENSTALPFHFLPQRFNALVGLVFNNSSTNCFSSFVVAYLDRNCA